MKDKVTVQEIINKVNDYKNGSITIKPPYKINYRGIYYTFDETENIYVDCCGQPLQILDVIEIVKEKVEDEKIDLLPPTQLELPPEHRILDLEFKVNEIIEKLNSLGEKK